MSSISADVIHDTVWWQPAFMQSWSITTRLAVLITVVVAVILLSAIGAAYWALARHVDREATRFLTDELHELQEVLGPESHHRQTMIREEINEEITSHWATPYYVRVLRDDGSVVAETPGMPPDLKIPLFPSPIDTKGLLESDIVIRYLPDGHSYRLVTVFAETVHDEHKDWTIQAALQRSHHHNLMTVYRRRLGFLFMVGLSIASGASALIAYVSLYPLRAITSTTQRITTQRLHERIAPSQWPADLMALATSFDTMLGHLEGSFDRLSRFSADLAHEVRRPLQNLRGEAEVALTRSRTVDEYRTVMMSSLEEYDRLAKMTDDLLFLARAEDPRLGLSQESFEGRSELEAVQDMFEEIAEEQDITLSCEGQAMLYADRSLVRRLLINLVSNALRHTSDGGTVTLSVQSTADRAVLLQVRDTGVGISPDHLPKLFDRFYQVNDTAHNTQGAGLGLSIVQSIMTLHGGTVATESAPGVGTTIRLIFPPAA